MSDEPVVRDRASRSAPCVGRRGVISAALRLMRPRQWTKNLLVFAALLFARRLFDPVAVIQAVTTFVSFCALASATYALNDVLDVERDREHPEKRRRPIASGGLSAGAAVGISLALAASGVALAASVNGALLAAGLFYLALTGFYSTIGKNLPLLDILLIASGFVVRAVAGALAISAPPSSWFLACTLFAAIFLALCKRKAELATLAGRASRHRPVLASYSPEQLQTLIAASMAAVLMSYALYVFDVRERTSAEPILLELTLPCVVYGVFRYYTLVEMRGLGDSPEEVLLADPGVQVAGVLFVLLAAASVYWMG